ncbi:unnamed protein product [Schistosoma curassoni]|uniref:GATA zinc finger domain-containing protein 14-like n=1 Tax=Schistosoma curassoni TaxID=6186 RepID=A0A183JYI0_9TREM|nr:unnamed protein product [Schistosoma curassoni]
MNNSIQDNAINSTGRFKLFSMINLSNSKMLKSCKTEKFRINLILRLRSIWSRSSLKSQRIESKHIHMSFINYDHNHNNNHHHHHHHYNPRPHHYHHRHHQKQKQYHHEHQQNCPCQSQSTYDPLNNPLKVERLDTGQMIDYSKQPNDNIQILLSRKYHSESCLFHPYNMHNYIHKCSHIHYHYDYNPCSKSIPNQIRNDINNLSCQLSNIKLQSSYIKHSLTTGNICCLYTLNCVPSLECITQPISSTTSELMSLSSASSSSSSTSANAVLSLPIFAFTSASDPP